MEGKRKAFEKENNEKVLIGISLVEQDTNREHRSRAIISKGNANLSLFKANLSRECEMWNCHSTIKVGLTK